jgi:hypothetical protein
MTESQSENYTKVESIGQIYYINMDHRTERNDFMLSVNAKKFGRVPFKRVSGKVGNVTEDTCVWLKSDERRCRGIAGLIQTLNHILDNEKIRDTTLILEDDYELMGSIEDIEKAA